MLCGLLPTPQSCGRRAVGGKQMLTRATPPGHCLVHERPGEHVDVPLLLHLMP